MQTQHAVAQGLQAGFADAPLRPFVRRAIRFMPSLADLHCIRTYAGLRPFTPDHLAIISEVEEVPGFYIAAGHEGDGIGLAPLTGELMGQIIHGEPTTVDVTPLRWSRFHQGAGDGSH